MTLLFPSLDLTTGTNRDFKRSPHFPLYLSLSGWEVPSILVHTHHCHRLLLPHSYLLSMLRTVKHNINCCLLLTCQTVPLHPGCCSSMRSFKEPPPYPSNGPAGNLETNLIQNLLNQAASHFAWLRLCKHISQVLQGVDVADRANLA